MGEAIKGKNVVLVPAKERDREIIFRWLTQSDLTSSMFGEPLYPEHRVPSWKDFSEDYTLDFFNEHGDGKGRCYLIIHNREEVGTVGYDLLDTDRNRVVLDIWMKSAAQCGHGYGSESLRILCDYLHQKYHISNFLICPSAKNQRAIAAFGKAGFKIIKALNRQEQLETFGIIEYDLNLLMKKGYNC